MLERTSIVVGSLWMVAVSAVLFFVPGIGALAGGLIGGLKVGSVKRGLGAAILPSIVAGGITGVLFSLFDMPIAGVLVGTFLIVAIAASSLGLLIGGALGGWLAEQSGELPKARTISR